MAAAPNDKTGGVMPPGGATPPEPTTPPQNQPNITPPEPPASPANADPPADPPPSSSDADDKLTMSRKSLDQRLERERAKAQADFLKKMGFDNMEAYQEWKKQTDAEAEEKAKLEREKMSEIERYKADAEELRKKAEEAESARAAAEEQAEAARVEAHLHSVFATKGIKNTEYAMFRIETKLSELGDGEELDENEFLDELLKNPSDSVALGFTNPDDKPPKSSPASTTQPKKGPEPKTPSNANPNKHASQMTPDEWQAFKKQHGLA